MSNQYTITVEFHENGRVKTIENTYNSEYGSMSDVLHEEVTKRICKIVDSNRQDITYYKNDDEQN